MDTTTWGERLLALVGTLGGAGLVYGIGRAMVALADRVFPSADRRLEDAAKRRKEHADRVQDLEKELEERNKQWLDAERRVLEERSRLIQIEVEMTLLRRNLKLSEGDTTVGTRLVQVPVARPTVQEDGPPSDSGG